jgi:DNA-binding transcriptional LysR family regulator
MFDDLALLRAFVAIVEAGSISAAARHQMVTQPTLSRHLAALEAKCGVALLRRDTHTMSLTDSGQRLLADARSMLQLAEESEQRMRQEQHDLRGLIRLFATIDFGQSLVSRLLAEFLKEHQAVTVELSLSNRSLHMLHEGCDVGVIVGELTDENVVARPVGEVERYPAAAPSLIAARRPVRNPSDLIDWPWLSLAGEQFGGSQSVTLLGGGNRRHDVAIAPVLTSEGATSLRETALAGLGVAILPDWLVREDVAAGRLVRLLPAWSATALPAYVVYPGKRLLPQRVRAFIDFAVKSMGSALHPAGSGRPETRPARASRRRLRSR